MEIQRNARNIKDMSEEEKKAIHLLQSYTGMTHKLTDNQGRPKLDQAIEKALNLIEKQQKEIKNLKEKNMILEGNKIGQQLAINTLKNNIQEQAINSISKDKIKEKLEELEATINEYYNSGIGIPISDEFQYKIDILQELLKEGDKNGRK